MALYLPLWITSGAFGLVFYAFASPSFFIIFTQLFLQGKKVNEIKDPELTKILILLPLT
jgi:hypothetical protein